MSQKLLQLRTYDERDVINVYALSGYVADTTTVIYRGLVVKVAGNGWMADAQNPIEFLGGPSAFQPSNVVSQRYGVGPKMVPTNAGDVALGMTLYDIRETDENGELLKFRPRKAAEMEACISGQAVPVVRKGMFHISGLTTGNGITGAITAGSQLYVGANGTLSSLASGAAVGIALGSTDSHGGTIVYFDVGV
jgi:hypothetical protein